MATKILVTLGMFIIDTFSYQDSERNELPIEDPEAIEVCLRYSALGGL